MLDGKRLFGANKVPLNMKSFLNGALIPRS